MKSEPLQDGKPWCKSADLVRKLAYHCRRREASRRPARRSQEIPEPLQKLCSLPGLALPHDQDVPAGVREGSPRALVARSIARELGTPVFRSRPRRRALSTSVGVPEAAADEHRLAPPGEDEIGSVASHPVGDPEAVALALN